MRCKHLNREKQATVRMWCGTLLIPNMSVLKIHLSFAGTLTTSATQDCFETADATTRRFLDEKCLFEHINGCETLDVKPSSHPRTTPDLN